MSLYGALFSGVAGLNAQSNKIGVISDNIANVNTVGYKGSTGEFSTLVTNSGINTAYSPGGVLGSARQQVSKQGLLQSTASQTDIAILGGGFFVVNQTSDGSGQVLYTRAGSFTQDATGNFRNSAGFYLQAWPLDRNGNLPGEPGNLNTTSSANLASLETVNVQNLTGTAAATTTVSVGANLQSSQSAFIGAAGEVIMDENDPLNSGLKGKDIIVPTSVDSLASGDAFTISTGAGVTTSYTYGGFSFGRNVTTAANGASGEPLLSSPTTVSGDTATLVTTAFSLVGATPFTTTNGVAAITVAHTAHGYNVGDSINIAGMTGATDANGIPDTEINGDHVITAVTANSYTFATTTAATSTGSDGNASITSTAEPFRTTNASATVVVSSSAHGLTTGDSVTISGVSGAVNGIPLGELNATHIITVIDDDHYSITVTSTASSTGSGGLGTIDQDINPFTTTASSNEVSVRQLDHGLNDGDVVTISGNTAIIGGLAASQFNGTFLIDVIDEDHYVITTASSATTSTGGGAGTVSAITRPFVGNILDATNVNTPFLGITGTSPFTSASLSFTITTATSGTVEFDYTSSSPNSQLGQFNNLANLAQAINDVNGLSARVANNRLYVSATDSNEAITFENGEDVGTEGPPVLAGIDWVGELGLANVIAGTDRFATMEGLAANINASAALTATVENPLAVATLRINVRDPLDTVSFSDRAIAAPLTALTTATPFVTTTGSNVVTISHPSATGFTTGDIITLDVSGLAGAGPFNGIPKTEFDGQFVVTVVNSTTYTITVSTEATATGGTGDTGLVVTPPNNSGSVLAALGLVASLNGAAYTTPATTGALGPAYDPTDSDFNMASGAIPAHFSRPTTIYDGLGTGHSLNISFLKTGINTWAVEVFAVPESDITSTLPNGQIAFGNVTFNGDGSLRSISSTLATPATIQWTSGATSSEVTFNWGSAGQPFGTPNASAIGLTDGLSQFNTNYNVNFVNQNGAPVGQLTGVAIDQDGFIIASYNNGETQRLFKIPLAEFANPDQLSTVSGNAFLQSSASGEVNLRQPGTSGMGTVSSAKLEASTVELADQLTAMIIAQRAYQANTKVISTADTLLSDLNQILR